jgi:hypothetical protein
LAASLSVLKIERNRIADLRRTSSTMQILFLDDDPMRATTFTNTWPESVWVTTAGECIRRLEEPWDEVHLDHDLAGETYVDHDRDDCGMAVVRWLCETPRDHLRVTRFFIHSHNENAACIMALHLKVTGYLVEVRPFGRRSPGPLASLAVIPRRRAHWGRRILDWLIGNPTPPKIF